MFYLNEIFFRLKFVFLSVSLLLCLCYFYKDILLTIFSISLLNSASSSAIKFSDFIYTHPIELFKTHFCFAILIITFFILPLILWQTLDFLKSSLNKSSYLNYLRLSVNSVTFIYVINSFSFIYLLPNIWFFFKNFNNSENSSQILKFFFELRVEEYFNFVFDFFYLTNTLILVFLFLFLLVSFFGVSNVIYWKKLFIFTNIVCATLLSPPDVYSQITILILLSFSFESILFFSLYFLNININYETLIRHHVKRD